MFFNLLYFRTVCFLTTILLYVGFPLSWVKAIPAFILLMCDNPKWTFLLAGLGDYFFDSPETELLGIVFFGLHNLFLSLRGKEPPNFDFMFIFIGLGLMMLPPTADQFQIAATCYVFTLTNLLSTCTFNDLRSLGIVGFICSDILVLCEIILKTGWLPGIGLPLYWGSLYLIALE